MLEDQHYFHRRILKWTIRGLARLSKLQLMIFFVATAVLISALIVLTIDFLWHGRFNLEMEFAGVMTPLLDAMLLGFLFTLILGELREEIEGRRLASAAIETSEKKLKALFHAVNDAIMIIDPSGHILDVNNVACERLGYSRDELLKMTPRNFDTPEYAPRVAERLAEAVRKGSAIFETAWVARDGRVIPIEINARTIEYDGKTAFISVARDISERKKMEDELKESNIFTGQVIRSAGEGIIVYGPDLRYQVWNPYMERLTGLPADKVVGQHPLTLFPFLLETGAFECLQKALQGDMPDAIEFQYTVPGTCRSGWVSHTEAPLQNAKGEIIGVIATVSDITERKRMEEALRESETKYRGLFESSRDAVMTLEPPSWKFTSGNPATLAMFGTRNEEHFVSLGPWELSPEQQPDGRASDEKAREMIETAMREGANLFEWTHQRINGQLFPATVLLSRIELHGKVFLQATVRDITELKQAENRLIKAKEEWERTFDSITDPLMILDTNYRVLRANKAMAEKLGVTQSEAVGFTCYEHVHGTGRPNEHCPHTLLLTDGKAHSAEIYEGRLGEYYLVAVSPLYGPDGKLYGSVHFARDITERKQAEEELKRLAHKISLILNSAGEGIYGVDMDGKVIFINPAAARMLGYEVEELLGRQSHATWNHHKPEGTALPVERCTLNEVLKEGTPCAAGDAIFWKKNGTRVPVKYSSTPMFEADKLVGAVVTFKDITGQLLEEQERNKLENQLRHAQKMEAVGTLAGGIAHDFNNILNVIIGYGTMALDRQGDDQISKEHLNEVLAAADKAANLTKRLLAFSRKQIADMKPVNVNEIIAGMEKMLSRIIGEDIIFSTELTPGKLIVMADAGQIEQVLLNLASNARDVMPNGGGLTITTESIEIDASYIAAHGYGKAGTYARIGVTDTGSGMDAETQKKIFEPFFTTKGIGEGTGLGLSIAYGIIKQHDGYIQVYSEAGKGTAFKILLPLIEEADAKGRERDAEAAVRGGTETILLAEDDDLVRKLSKIVLESFGYTVITAVDGEESVTKYLENKDTIRLVILDMIMPKKNGREAYEEMRRINPDVRALFSSGYTMELIHKRELIESGMDFILKPVSPKDLLKKAREVLDR
jgi:PAS domain S-box-containing protein